MLIPPVLLLLTSLQAAAAAPRTNETIREPVGICVRWSTDPEHVSDAVVVTSSGDTAVDRRVREHAKIAKLRRPSSPGYTGQWVGMLVATSPDRPRGAAPTCTQLNGSAPRGSSTTAQ
jgi:hypothetical protein